MQCRVCGRAVVEGDKFCTACGAELTDDDATTEMPTVGRDDSSDEADPAAPRPGDPIDLDSDATTQHVTRGQSTAEAAAAPSSADRPAPAPAPATQPTTTSADSAPTELLAATDGQLGDDDPVWAPTGPVAAVSATGITTDTLPATEPITEVRTSVDTHPREPLGALAVDPAAAQPTAVVTTPTRAPTAEIRTVPTPISEGRGFRFTAVFGLSILGSVVTMIASFATIVTVSSDDRIVSGENTPANFRIGSWIPSDLADNLPIAVLIAVALLMCGGVAAGFGWRGGSGLAAGSGLAIVGLAALTIGLAQIPIDAAYEMAAIPTDDRFTLTITRDLGYWLQLAAAAIGIVVFFASLNDAFGDHRAGLNPWIAALGALSGLVMAAGPLIPEGLSVISDNWYVTEGPGEPPAMLLSTRIVQLALLALTSLIGFLSVRRWGLGVAVGGALPSLWLTVSTLFDLTDHPVGPGFRNPGVSEMTVHGVTIIGASALAAFLILAIVAAFDQAQHEW